MGKPSLFGSAAIILAQQNRSLPAPLRAKAIMALLGIIVLGVGLAAMIVLGGRAVKRLARHRRGPTNARDDSWYRKPLESEPAAGNPPPDDNDT
ncbi:MAG: hypothetical protein ACREHD_21850 [Pirellulales bacterium]